MGATIIDAVMGTFPGECKVNVAQSPALINRLRQSLQENTSVPCHIVNQIWIAVAKNIVRPAKHH
jgi:hypothetical protein